jgi:uncharacterized membrane protein
LLLLVVSAFAQIATMPVREDVFGSKGECASPFQPFNAASSGNTEAWSINDASDITGYYYDTSGSVHGFVRGEQGQITVFDVPGAIRTFAYDISADGKIIGYYLDSKSPTIANGFVRNARGTIATLNAPSPALSLVPQSINAQGDIAGLSGTSAFLLTSDGRITLFNVPGATATSAFSINNKREITGRYYDATGSHAYLRTSDGRITSFDVSGTNPLTSYIAPQSVNNHGQITGYYWDTTGSHGFLRYTTGEITTFDPPGSIATGALRTIAHSINENGSVVGYYSDSTFRLHPFVRDARGHITTFDAPGAIGDTVALSINDHDEIAGTYYGPDSTSTNRDHGFLLKLRCTKTSD